MPPTFGGDIGNLESNTTNDVSSEIYEMLKKDVITDCIRWSEMIENHILNTPNPFKKLKNGESNIVRLLDSICYTSTSLMITNPSVYFVIWSKVFSVYSWCLWSWLRGGHWRTWEVWLRGNLKDKKQWSNKICSLLCGFSRVTTQFFCWSTIHLEH